MKSSKPKKSAKTDRGPSAHDGTEKARLPGARERNRVRIHDDIYDAALSLFNERGYAGVTVDDICAAAGVSKATFFRYFDSKYGLVDEFNQRMSQRIDNSIDLERMSATECIRTATETVYQEWTHSAPQMRALAREFLRMGAHVSDDLGDPMARGLLRTLTLAIEKGQKRGEFPSRLEASLVAPMIVMAWTLSFAAWVDRDDETDFCASIHGLVQLVISGLSDTEASSGSAIARTRSRSHSRRTATARPAR